MCIRDSMYSMLYNVRLHHERGTSTCVLGKFGSSSLSGIWQHCSRLFTVALFREDTVSGNEYVQILCTEIISVFV